MPNIHSNITFGLVSIPVTMNPIIKNNDISFNQLHKKCLHRIEYVKYCPYCKKPNCDIHIQDSDHWSKKVTNKMDYVTGVMMGL